MDDAAQTAVNWSIQVARTTVKKKGFHVTSSKIRDIIA